MQNLEKSHKAFFDSYKIIPLEEFLLNIGEEQPNFFSRQYNKLESAVSRISRVVSKDITNHGSLKEYTFFKKEGIMGLSDVLNDLVNKINTSATLYQTNKAGIILLCGPTGSGKTVIGEALGRGLMNDFLENAGYTLKFHTSKEEIYCPFDESPINLFTSSRILTPNSIREKYAKYGNGELCFSCTENYMKMTREISMNPGSDKPSFENLLSECIKIVRIGSKSAVIDLSDKNLPQNMTNIIKHANRGILHINIDNLEWEKIPPSNYKFLLSLRDNVIPLNDGTYFKPDMLTIIYGNEEVLKIFRDESPQLVDRMLSVYVRRNLSYSEESKIIRKWFETAKGVGYSCISNEIFDLLAKFCVGTRIDLEKDSDDIEELLESYEKYENYKKLEKDEYKNIMERLNFSSEDPPVDGWTTGLSNSSFINSFIDYASNSNKGAEKCFTLEDVIKLMNKIDYQYDEFDYDAAKLYENGSYLEVRQYIKDLINNIVNRDVNYAYLAIINGENALKIENLFSQFYSYQKLRDIKKTTWVSGDKKSVEDNLEELSDKLGIDKEKRQEFEDSIKDLLNEYNEMAILEQDEKADEPPFTFLDIIMKNPELMSSKGSLENYIMWDMVAANVELSKDDDEKLGKLKTCLVKPDDKSGYCINCAGSVLKLFAKGLNR